MGDTAPCRSDAPFRVIDTGGQRPGLLVWAYTEIVSVRRAVTVACLSLVGIGRKVASMELALNAYGRGRNTCTPVLDVRAVASPSLLREVASVTFDVRENRPSLGDMARLCLNGRTACVRACCQPLAGLRSKVGRTSFAALPRIAAYTTAVSPAPYGRAAGLLPSF